MTHILNRDDVKAIYSAHFANPFDVLPKHVEQFAIALESALMEKLCREPAAHMFPSDLERFKTTETFAQAYSVAVGNPDEHRVPLYALKTAPTSDKGGA